MSSQSTQTELPPRARRIRTRNHHPHHPHGTTSACAENTKTAQDANYHTRNYLRVRGEYALTCGLRRSLMELPPRARRIRPSGIDRWAGDGTTSACAENTAMLDIILPGWRNYLRVRGEYNAMNGFMAITAELPPRARRIPLSKNSSNEYSGTTSACAENTVVELTKNYGKRNYLRVRGEYKSMCSIWIGSLELPPRARRILVNGNHALRQRGTTSACAENTRRHLNTHEFRGNYLRVRGEYNKLT